MTGGGTGPGRRGPAGAPRLSRVVPLAGLALFAGCLPAVRPGAGSVVATPGVAMALQASPSSRFSMRLVDSLERRDFDAYRALHVNPLDASREVFDLLADLEPGDFVRMETAFTVDGKVSAEMSVWMVVRDGGDPVKLEPMRGEPDLPEGKTCEAEFIIADSFVRFMLVAVEGEWLVREAEEFGEE